MHSALPITTAPLWESNLLGVSSMKQDQPSFLKQFEFNIIPTNRRSQVSPDFVTTSKNNSNQNCADVKTQPSPFGPLTHELRERLLGKSPLRLVVSREPQFIPSATPPAYWIETLECGHATEAYPTSIPGESYSSVPCAKRRRCTKCKDALGIKDPNALTIPPAERLRVGKLSNRVAEYLFAAKFKEIDPWAKDDYHVAAVATLYAAQGYEQPWSWAFLEYYGKHFHKVLPYWLERDAIRDAVLGPGLAEGEDVYQPKKRPTSVKSAPPVSVAAPKKDEETA